MAQSSRSVHSDHRTRAVQAAAIRAATSGGTDEEARGAASEIPAANVEADAYPKVGSCTSDQDHEVIWNDEIDSDGERSD